MKRQVRSASILAATLATGLAALPAQAETVKIGVILTYSGPQATLGEQITRGLELYYNGPSPDLAKRLAQELVTRDHVQFLTGVVWSQIHTDESVPSA
jgi:branched-chain amino acid transport system substrate-binding protein